MLAVGTITAAMAPGRHRMAILPEPDALPARLRFEPVEFAVVWRELAVPPGETRAHQRLTGRALANKHFAYLTFVGAIAGESHPHRLAADEVSHKSSRRCRVGLRRPVLVGRFGRVDTVEAHEQDFMFCGFDDGSVPIGHRHYPPANPLRRPGAAREQAQPEAARDYRCRGANLQAGFRSRFTRRGCRKCTPCPC